jgi:hypothetical protein
MRPSLSPLTFALLLVACGQEAGVGQHAATDMPATVRAEPGRVEGLSVRGEPLGAGEIVPVIEARGDAPVRVKRAIGVERRDGERWTAVPVRNLTLRPDCEHAADACITLVRGGGLRPPAWNGKSGDAQCACTTCTAAPAGEYRFVLESCEGPGRVTGAPFSLAR